MLYGETHIGPQGPLVAGFVFSQKLTLSYLSTSVKTSMNTLFVLVLLLLVLVLIVGLIKPSLLKMTRRKVALVFGTLVVVAFIIVGATAPKSSVPAATADTTSQVAVKPIPTPAVEQKTNTPTPTPTPAAQPSTQENQATKIAAQKELDETMALAKTAKLITTYEFSDKASVVYADKVWYTQTVQFKKDFLAKIGTLKKQITGYQHFEVRDAYSDEKVAEITSFSGSLEVYK